MKTIQIVILTLISLLSYAEGEPLAPFEQIITKKLFITFSTFMESAELQVQTEKKNGVTIYSYTVNSLPSFGMSIKVGPAYSLLPKGKIAADQQAVAKSTQDLEEAIEAKKDDLTDEEYQEARKSLKLFMGIMAGNNEERYPKLGSQALHTGWTDGDTTTFTTTDMKYDLEIQRAFTEGVFFRVPEMAQQISDSYDNTRPQQIVGEQ